MIAPLRLATTLAVALAAAALVVGGEAGDALATTLAIGLVIAPLARVAFLAVRWARLRDLRFAWRATVLLVEVGAITTIALAT